MRSAAGASRDEAAPLVLREEVHLVATGDGQQLALTEARLPDRRQTRRRLAFLLLHGFAQNRKAFTLGPLPRELLERGARVFLGELRGHGESSAPPDAWSLTTHLEHDCPALLEGVRERARVDAVHLVGHSMGGLLGCALLARDAPLASLTLAATPLLLGADRPLVRLASLVLGPFATIAPRSGRVPMQHFLGALSRPLSAPDARGPLRLLQKLTRLANPAAAPPEALREILANADAESPLVMEELARNAVGVRPRLAEIDLVAALRATPLPVAAVVGSDDIFAPPAAVEPLRDGEHAGPRRVVEVPGGTHVDAVMGHHVPETLASLWDFLVPRRTARASAQSPPGRSARS